MTWIRRHRLRQYLKDSIWITPLLGMIAALIVVRICFALDTALGLRLDFHPDAARTVMITLAASVFTLIVFVSSALLIALQLASAQMSPRIIALVFRDRMTKVAMTLFVFTFTLTVAVSKYACIVCMGFFLFLIDHLGRMLRPHKALRTVAMMGRGVIESVYPRKLSEVRRDGSAPLPSAGNWSAGEQSYSVPARKDGVILACDMRGIVAAAKEADCVVEMAPQVGDFVARGTPLFRVYRDVGGELSPQALQEMVAIGSERSPEQDPTFAFRIIVDIASKALSPAINDPTTAVLAIDQLHHLLRTVGARDLDDERLRDSSGRVRLLCRTPGWDDFVRLASTEIRQYGKDSIQVNRRLRAMLESLIAILPPERHAALQRELALLHRGASRFFADPEDQALATISDSQGVGGGGTSDGNGRGTATPAAAT
jgi:uncharacterized membrane protein